MNSHIGFSSQPAALVLCLATGARWSEAEGLKGNQISADQIIYVKTEGKKNRAVPITEK